MALPASRRATKRRRSSISDLAFHGIHTSRLKKAKRVTHVSGTKCHLCLGPLIGCRLPGGKRIVDMVTLRINDRFGWGAARLNQHGETSRLARAVRPTAPQGS